jgi:hypothetical protein
MSETIAALLLVAECRCLRCNHRWRDSSLLFRTDRGYSYEQTPDRLRLLADHMLPISGRRMTKRAVGACHNCVTAPNITIWEGRLTYDYEPTEVVSRTRRRTGSNPDAVEQQRIINSILDGI